jgi:DNA phosphorothioation-dependent restriction protein DptG
MSDLKTLSAEWLGFKTAEEKATTERRKIEDQMVKLLAIPPDFESTETASRKALWSKSLAGSTARLMP